MLLEMILFMILYFCKQIQRAELARMTWALCLVLCALCGDAPVEIYRLGMQKHVR